MVGDIKLGSYKSGYIGSWGLEEGYIKQQILLVDWNVRQDIGYILCE